MTDNITLDETLRPAESAQRFRRLVTGVDEAGRSVFVEDAAADHVQVVASTPAFVTTNFWRHDAVPVDNSGPADDGLSGRVGVAPPAGGSVFRAVEFPPDAVLADRGVGDQTHATPSLDYAIVLSGEIWAVLDEDERLMKTGDVLIQRGTRHAWSNRSEESCVVAFALIGGTAQ